MATKTKEFDLFGVKYRTRQFAAVRALEIMEQATAVHPLEVLAQTEVYDAENRKWKALDSREAINEFVIDRMHVLPPRMALQGVLRAVNEFSFGFVNGWRGVAIPKRFTAGIEPRASNHTDPLIAQLLQDEVTSLRELEEYYSLEDAFKLFDVMVAKGVNAALSQEQAMKDAKKR